VNKRNPVASLLRLRSIREKQARRFLSQTQQEAMEAQRHVAERREQYERRPTGEGSMLTPLQLRTLQLQGIRSLELLAEAAAAYEHAELAKESARLSWMNAQTDLKSAEQLDQRRREEGALQARIASQRSLDELSVMMRRSRRCS
jgi:flagellar biosynthesis chaperone FliJ